MHTYSVTCCHRIWMCYSNWAAHCTALWRTVHSTRWAFTRPSRSQRSTLKTSPGHTSALMDPSWGPSSGLLSLAVLFSAKLCWPEGCFLNKSRGTVAFEDKEPRRNKFKKNKNKSALIWAVSIFKDDETGKEEEQQLIARTVSTPQDSECLVQSFLCIFQLFPSLA